LDLSARELSRGCWAGCCAAGQEKKKTAQVKRKTFSFLFKPDFDYKMASNKNLHEK